MAVRRHLGLAPDLPGVPSTEPAGREAWIGEELALTEGDASPEPERGALLVNSVCMRLGNGRLAEYDAGDAIYRKGDRGIVEGGPGDAPAWGVVVVPSRRKLVLEALPRVLRHAAEEDRLAQADLTAREEALFQAARRVVHAANTPAKIVRAEALFGGQKFALYFASEEKIRFGELLRDLSQQSRERVEFRQIGLRDASKAIGGVGPCGLQLCCNTFLSEFAPVSMKMAKDQGLAQNPQRLSGLCGRLLCCLVYEEAYYRRQRKLIPHPGERVTTKQGNGRVRDVDVLKMQVRVVLESGELLTFDATDVQPVQPRGAEDEPDDEGMG